MLNNILGLPSKVGEIDVYPITILEWNEFEKIAPKFLLYGDRFLKYKLKAPKDVKLFDFLVTLISQDVVNTPDGEVCTTLKDFERMFSMVLHKDVQLMYSSKTKSWLLKFDGGWIDRENYNDFRKVIMEMNLIHEPVIAPNEFSQKILDDAIKSMSKGGEKVDLEAMIVYVTTFMGMKPNEFIQMTYYQLRAKFEMCQRIQTSDAIHIYRSVGAKVEPLNVAQALTIKENPYSFDKLVKKVDSKKEEQQRKALGA